jgi:hypothetical protein
MTDAASRPPGAVINSAPESTLPEGNQRTDVPVYLVLTRVRLRHVTQLPVAILTYRRVLREARLLPSLKKAALFLEDPWTLVILSIWDGEPALLQFGTDVVSHVHAARAAFAMSRTRHGRTEIWSTQWRLSRTSHNLSWGDREAWTNLIAQPTKDGAVSSAEG